VYTMSGPSVIRLNVSCDPAYLKIGISNDFDPDSVSRKGTGTGLQNVRQRLATIYGRHDLLTITREQNAFDVLLKVPRVSS